ncbi:hypothetical protein SAMN05216217_1082 [Halopseudomonas yangmingensis]|uniref:Uncharacterized protein n=1 Tax=Halopseudomonas yangmingensis TaxID=1720063 RepID=A0A1I4RV84_9GAMM|nr:hypothetical protein SAMN05216217_1082 [Halopseudomonas yangmingensis]
MRTAENTEKPPAEQDEEGLSVKDINVQQCDQVRIARLYWSAPINTSSING